MILERISQAYGSFMFNLGQMTLKISFLCLICSVSAWSQVQTYFNRNSASSYVDPFKNVSRPGDNLEEIILKEIGKANTSISLAVQELRLPKIAKLLRDKSNAGVTVRVVLENKYNQNVIQMRNVTTENPEEVYEISRYEELVALVDQDRNGIFSDLELANNDAVEILRGSNVKVIDDTSDGSKGSGLMHHKFIVIDNKTTIVSTANFTPSCIHGDILKAGSKGNANSLMVVRSEEFSSLFNEEFQEMWSKKFGAKKKFRAAKKIQVAGTTITVKFSPTSTKQGYSQSTNGLIAQELSNARSKVEAALFVFSEQALANALEDNKSQPYTAFMVESKFAFRYYSELIDLLGLAALGPKCEPEPNNRPWKRAADFAASVRLSDGDVMHHKFAVIDSQRVLVGSHNWSQSANLQNDEYFLVIENANTASQFSQEISRMKNFASKTIPSAVTTQSCQQ
jgi:phosphatidylserine/phosphatidylglycerophosphate/cardiolipin synthase-like enzyme